MSIICDKQNNEIIQQYLKNTIRYMNVCSSQESQKVRAIYNDEKDADLFDKINSALNDFSEIYNKDTKDVDNTSPENEAIYNLYYRLARSSIMPDEYRINMCNNLMDFCDKHGFGNQNYAWALSLQSSIVKSDNELNSLAQLQYMHRRGLSDLQYTYFLQKIYFNVHDKKSFPCLHDLGIACARRKNKFGETYIPAVSSWSKEQRKKRSEIIENFFIEEEKHKQQNARAIFSREEQIMLAKEALDVCQNNERGKVKNLELKEYYCGFLADMYAGKEPTLHKYYINQMLHYQHVLETTLPYVPYRDYKNNKGLVR